MNKEDPLKKAHPSAAIHSTATHAPATHATTLHQKKLEHKKFSSEKNSINSSLKHAQKQPLKSEAKPELKKQTPVLLPTSQLPQVPIETKIDSESEVDLSADVASSFNPYLFSRDPLLILVPIFMLILLGLHLLPIPRRKRNKKIRTEQFLDALKTKPESQKK